MGDIPQIARRTLTLRIINLAISWTCHNGTLAADSKASHHYPSDKRRNDEEIIMNIGAYTTYLIVLAIAFIGLVAWVFNKKRKMRWQHDGEIPFEEDKS